MTLTRATSSKRRKAVHLLDGKIQEVKIGDTFSQKAICGAKPSEGWSRFSPSQMKICPKCEAKKKELEAGQ